MTNQKMEVIMNENKTAEVALKSGKNFEFPYGIRFAYVDIEAEG
jgi:hypothetical protein